MYLVFHSIPLFGILMFDQKSAHPFSAISLKVAQMHTEIFLQIEERNDDWRSAADQSTLVAGEAMTSWIRSLLAALVAGV